MHQPANIDAKLPPEYNPNDPVSDPRLRCELLVGLLWDRLVEAERLLGALKLRPNAIKTKSEIQFMREILGDMPQEKLCLPPFIELEGVFYPSGKTELLTRAFLNQRYGHDPKYDPGCYDRLEALYESVPEQISPYSGTKTCMVPPMRVMKTNEFNCTEN